MIGTTTLLVVAIVSTLWLTVLFVLYGLRRKKERKHPDSSYYDNMTDEEKKLLVFYLTKENYLEDE